MLTSLSSGVSGLDAFQQQMDIIGNNIANLNTTGFKTATGNLVDAFSDTLQAATAATGSVSGTDAMQVGTGVTTASITNNWSEGAINSTGVTSNLAINGNGFFMVQDPSNSSAQYATQDGTFSVNSNGFLVTSTGMDVLGYNTTALSATGPIKIDTTGSSSTAAMTSYTINSQGVITVNQADGTSFTRGQILLQNFVNPQALSSVGNNLYSNMANAGPLAAMATPGSSGLGTIQSGALELSNVDLSAQMANLITAQRGFEANSKMITTSDELLQDVVNMKR
ncbi:MAG: flagellar hook-basal body complex protein [Verrucomicrobiota bacterium]|jgi:flagellar hook protein FlgE